MSDPPLISLTDITLTFRVHPPDQMESLVGFLAVSASDVFLSERGQSQLVRSSSYLVKATAAFSVHPKFVSLYPHSCQPSRTQVGFPSPKNKCLYGVKGGG
jgi:hypothetical protein